MQKMQQNENARQRLLSDRAQRVGFQQVRILESGKSLNVYHSKTLTVHFTLNFKQSFIIKIKSLYS